MRNKLCDFGPKVAEVVRQIGQLLRSVVLGTKISSYQGSLSFSVLFHISIEVVFVFVNR